MSSFQVSKEGDKTVVSIEGYLIVGNRHELKAVVAKAMESGVKNLILDFSKALLTDASGLRLIVSIRRKLKEIGGSLELRNLNEEIRGDLRATNLDLVLTIVE